MMAGSRKQTYILLVMLAAVVLIAAILNNAQEEKHEEIAIPEEILECDYCTFNYRTPFILSYTHIRPDGNRVAEGKLDILNANYTDIQLSDRPEWVLAAPSANGSIWSVVMEDGEVQAFELSEGVITEINISPSKIHPESPPLLMVKDNEPFIIAPGNWNESLLSHPIILTSSGRTVFIENTGDLVFRVNNREFARLDVNALPDARLLLDGNERILLISGPSKEYTHGVLGDNFEGSSITLVETVGKPVVSRVIDIPQGYIIEGLAPIWTDLDGDGKREIIVTLSNENEGARIVVFDEEGNILAEGKNAGAGYRWRHQIAVAAFGPAGETELLDVLTPHIGGKVELSRFEDTELAEYSSLSGFSSHQAGSRNLDMAIAGNFDSDPYAELIIPAQDYRKLGILEHNETGINVKGYLELDGKVNTNIASVNTKKGFASVGVGTDTGLIRIWY